MTSANRPPGGGAPRQPWTPDAAPKGVTCPACGLANEAGARTCRNCGLPIASADDPVRGVAAGHVDLPKARRSGLSATIGFVMVVGLLLVGGSLAVSGGGILGSGGRFFGAEASPSPTPATATVIDSTTGDVLPIDLNGEGGDATPKPSGTNFDFTCEDAAIEDLSKGQWFLSDLAAGQREADDGTLYDQVYWKLSRTTDRKVKNPVTVTMQWTTPDDAKERFGEAIGRVQGDRAILVTFNGPVDIAANATIESDQFDSENIDQIRRVQLFETKGKVRTVIGLKSDSCARMRATGWGQKAKVDNARVVLDLERF